MGIVSAQVELSSAREDDLAPVEVTALVDTGSTYLCIPPHVALQLNLPVQDRRGVTLADGREETVDYVGPVRVRFANRQCIVGALVLGNQVLLGAIPMEDMDLVINPLRRTVTVNPANPNVPMGLAMANEVHHDD
ncbi:MAG TPA: clan AA aspartic protease [Allosphingosinicella sp.]|jgi:clan AA aspartic protease